MTTREYIDKLKNLRALILDVMTGAAPHSALEGYSYGEADGTQSTRRRDPNSLMKWLNEVDKKIAELEKQARGGGLMTFGTNRYG